MRIEIIKNDKNATKLSIMNCNVVPAVGEQILYNEKYLLSTIT